MCLFAVTVLVLYNITTGSKDSNFSLAKQLFLNFISVSVFYVKVTSHLHEIAKHHKITKYFPVGTRNLWKRFLVEPELLVMYSISFVIQPTNSLYLLQCTLQTVCIFVYRMFSLASSISDTVFLALLAISYPLCYLI